MMDAKERYRHGQVIGALRNRFKSHFRDVATEVADVVDDDEVVPAAIGLARRIAGNAPRAVALAADAARRAHDQPLREGLATERHNFLRALGTDDAREGLSAFTAGRTPAFTGR